MSKYPEADIHYRTCNLCEACCGIVIHHQQGRIVSIKGDEQDPLSRGHICPKAVALQDVYEDPDRLKRPLAKTAAGGWEEISWEDAYERVAQNLKRIQKAYGFDAVAMYAGNPTVHNYGTTLFAPRLARALRTKKLFSATSVDQLPHHFVSQYMLGHWLLLPVPDLDRTDFFLVLGANPMASNGSMMTAPNFVARLRALQARGGKMYVVDPRRTETAKRADRHYFIRPGRDVYLLLGILNRIFSKGKIHLEKLEEHVKGLDEVRAAIAPFTPEKMATASGLSEKDICEISDAFSAAPKAVCYGRMGVSTQRFGTLCQWLIYVLNIVTGNFDREGGAMFSSPALPVVRGGSTMHRFGRWHSRKRGLPEFVGELPVSCMAEEILEEEEGRIRALIVSAGNPVLSTPNGRQLEKALANLEFMVSVDIYLNETSRHADLILPPATGLETDHYDLVFHNLAVRNTVKYSEALFQPEPGMRFDWQIYKELARRLRQKQPSWFMRCWERFENPKRLLALGLFLGSYGKWNKGRFNMRGLSLAKIRKNPHGIDLGPLRSCLPEALRTADRKIDLAPAPILSDLGRATAHLEKSESVDESESEHDFLLIGRRHLRDNNSWMHNTQRLMRGRNRCTLLMHPDDAARLHVEDGQKVQVESSAGFVEVELEVSDDIMPGVVSLPHGYGHWRPGMALPVASKNPGVSINDLTDERDIDTLSGNAAFSGLPVKVS